MFFSKSFVLVIIIYITLFFPADGPAEDRLNEWLKNVSQSICTVNETEIKSISGHLVKIYPGLKVDQFGINQKRPSVTFVHQKWGQVLVSFLKIKTTIKAIEIKVSGHIPAGGQPRMFIRQTPSCQIVIARELRYKERKPEFLIHWDETLTQRTLREPLNPPVPIWDDYNGVRIAHVDSGVN